MRTPVMVSASAALTIAIFSLCSFGHAASPPVVKVPLDVEVYDQPGGEGEPRGGFLPAGSTVGLWETKDHWCHVKGPDVPGKDGWVWCGMGDDGKDYSLHQAKVEPNEGGGGVFNCHFAGGIPHDITAKDEQSAVAQYTAWLKPYYNDEGDPPGVACSPTP